MELSPAKSPVNRKFSQFGGLPAGDEGAERLREDAEAARREREQKAWDEAKALEKADAELAEAHRAKKRAEEELARAELVARANAAKAAAELEVSRALDTRRAKMMYLRLLEVLTDASLSHPSPVSGVWLEQHARGCCIAQAAPTDDRGDGGFAHGSSDGRGRGGQGAEGSRGRTECGDPNKPQGREECLRRLRRL